MFAVLFEVQPRPERWDDYLAYAKLLKPELERIDGFVDNVRYRSLGRPGRLLSLSSWRDEKALVRWRTHAVHHGVQVKGRHAVFEDYRLRVGQLTHDTRLPPGCELREQRLDETAVGAATALTLVDAHRPADGPAFADAHEAAVWLGLEAPSRAPASAAADGSGECRDGTPKPVDWDVFEAVLSPGDFILLAGWRDAAAAEAFERQARLPPDARCRRVRVVRDYGLADRREAPQYHAPVEGASSG